MSRKWIKPFIYFFDNNHFHQYFSFAMINCDFQKLDCSVLFCLFLKCLSCPLCASLRAATLQEELQKKSSTLGDAQKHVEKLEQEKSANTTRLKQLTEEGHKQKSELEKKIQGMRKEHQKTQEERDAQAKELQQVKEALSKTSIALKDNQIQLEKEKKSSTAVLEEKVGSGILVFL